MNTLRNKETNILGYLRNDGRKGIRNLVLIVYLVECAHHISKSIAASYPNDPIQTIGFTGCYPNAYADSMMRSLCTHPNVGAVLLVSLGCESFNRNRLLETVKASGREAALLVIQQEGGTSSSIAQGKTYIANFLQVIRQTQTVIMHPHELSIGIVSGGSDATSGITANPAAGEAFDLLHAMGCTTIFENTGEMIGLEKLVAARATKPQLGLEIENSIIKAAKYYSIMGHGSFAPGNAEGGLTTLEEKAMGAYQKSGTAPIRGLIKPSDIPQAAGLYLMDIVPDGEPRFGFPNPTDISEMNEIIASGAHLILFTTGRGSVAGSAISPVIKICANPDSYSRMKEDMDINAGRMLTDNMTAKQIGVEIVDYLLQVAAGVPSCPELLGHQEFSLHYKSFEPLGPSCLG